MAMMKPQMIMRWERRRQKVNRVLRTADLPLDHQRHGRRRKDMDMDRIDMEVRTVDVDGTKATKDAARQFRETAAGGTTVRTVGTAGRHGNRRVVDKVKEKARIPETTRLSRIREVFDMPPKMIKFWNGTS